MVILKKFKKLVPMLEGFECIKFGGLAEPLLNKDIFELSKLAENMFLWLK